jgi:hypothetical protein
VTSDILISQALAFLVVLVLGGLCWILFGRKNIVLDKMTATQQLWFDEPDFQPSHWLMDDAGSAAIAVNDSEEIALVSTIGQNYVTRRLPAGAVVTHDGAQLIISLPDHTFRKIAIKASSEADAGTWAKRLSGKTPTIVREN